MRADDEHMRPIAAVERDTGINRDTLRVWERRYGFPRPERDQRGGRLYPTSQVRRLQLIRRLLDQGMRPGRVVALGEGELRRLTDDLGRPPRTGAKPRAGGLLLRAIEHRDDVAMYSSLEGVLRREGMRGLILGTAAPVVREVGDRWAAGRMEIFEEHLFTRFLTRFLHAAMPRIAPDPNARPVLLATLPGERHGIGLLMVEALLRERGRRVVNLGTEVPVDQLARAVEDLGANVVALSFSGSYSYTSVYTDLQDLVARLPSGVAVWVGGGGVAPSRRLPPGVRMRSLEEL